MVSNKLRVDATNSSLDAWIATVAIFVCSCIQIIYQQFAAIESFVCSFVCMQFLFFLLLLSNFLCFFFHLLLRSITPVSAMPFKSNKTNQRKKKIQNYNFNIPNAQHTEMQIVHVINYRHSHSSSLFSTDSTCFFLSYTSLLLCRFVLSFRMHNFKYDNEINCIRSRSTVGLLTGLHYITTLTLTINYT